MKDIKNALESTHLEAISLPFRAYTDSDFFSAECNSIFLNDWVYVCSAFDLQLKGDYKCLQVAGESIVIIKQADGSLKCVSNLCRHRGTPLLDEGLGNQLKVVCPYHAWTYGLDGKLQGVPFAGKAKIDKSDHCLKAFSVEIWNNLVFVNLSGSATLLSERYNKITKYFDIFDSKRFIKSYQGKNEVWKSNWKLIMENAMESYHLFKVHKNTLEINTPTKKAFYLEGCSEFTVTGGKLNYDKGLLGKLFSDKKYEYLEHYILISLAPNFVGILTYESFDWIQVLPISENESIVSSGGMSSSGSQGSRSEQNFVKDFFEEDKQICERVQDGMKSKLGSGGRLVEMEKIIVDFHQYISSRVFASKVDDYFIDASINKFFPGTVNE